MKRKLNNFLWILIILGISFWFIGINEPFVGSYGANLNYFTLAAKNFNRFGYLRLGFVPSYYAGGNTSQIPEVYLHHPVLYFTFVSLPFKLFGFRNWVAGVTPIIFSILTLFWLYKIGSLVWDKKTGFWAAFLGAIFPIMTVFGRQTIFEVPVLSILLGVYYFFLRFIKDKKRKSLIFLSLLSLLAILIDWAGAYFVIPWLLLYRIFPKKKEKTIAVINYISIILFGISLFLIQVFFWKGNFSDLTSAILSRRDNPELFSLPLPYLRLMGVTFLRFLVYFTPFSILAVLIFAKDIFSAFEKKSFNLRLTTLVFFFIFGLVNFIALPAASFGHIYFLFYFIPFFSFILGRFVSQLYLKRRNQALFVILSLFIFSLGVTYMKHQQVLQQVWRFEAARMINQKLIPHEEIAVLGFPGDIFEQYFFHPSKPIGDYIEFLNWLERNSQEKRKAVFSCWGECGEEDSEFIESLPYKKIQFGKAWLVTSEEVEEIVTEINIEKEPVREESRVPIIIKLYRLIKNAIGVGQL